MLSIEDIKNVSFRRANFGGYKPEDVDAFIDDIQISYEEMMRENENLKLKLDKFHEEDNSIRSVILNAQKVAQKALEDAKDRTTDMMHKAAEASEKMISEAKKEVSTHNEISERLKSESAKLRKQLEDIYTKHKEIIDSIPNHFSKNDKEETPKPIDIFSGKGKNSAEISQLKVISPKVDIESFSKKEEKEISGGFVDHNADDIFSSEKLESPQSKFKNLKFGKNYNKEEDKPKGVYSGIFRK